MKKYKIRMIISLMVATMLLIYAIIPMFSLAENEELNMQLNKIEINGVYQINITGSSTSQILAFSYVKEKKTPADFNNNVEAIMAYFEGENATKINITDERYINEKIDVTTFGTYSIYMRNADGEIQIGYITINDISEIKLTAIFQQNIESKEILINASSTSNIVAVKVKKTNNAEEQENFTNEVNLLQQENTIIEVRHQVAENGIYQVYVEDANKNKKICTVNVFEGDSPITIDTSVENQKIIINVKDCISKINTIKIAPKSDIETIADFETKGTEISFEGTNNITTTYEVAEEGTYVIYAKNQAGNSLMKSVSVATKPVQTIEFYKVEGKDGIVYVKATDERYDINFVKYLISSEVKTIEEVKNSGTEIIITPGKTLNTEIVSADLTEENYLFVYVRDTFGFGKLTGMKIKAIAVVENSDNEEVLPDDDFVEIPDDEENSSDIEDGNIDIPEDSENIEIPDENVDQDNNSNNDVNILDIPEDEPDNNDDENNEIEIPDPDKGEDNENNKESINDNKSNNSDLSTDDKSIDILEEEFEEIEDIEDNINSDSVEVYPQTGVNNYIIFIGIGISLIVAIISYKKMKQEENK